MKTQDRKVEEFVSSRNPIVYGIFGTVLLFAIYGHLAFSRSCQKGVCQTNYKHFLASSPNEIGDTLAGIAGILAFLWIIVTVFLQSKELRSARVEYEKMARAQERQVALLSEQGKLIKNERLVRSQETSQRVMDELMEAIVSQLKQEPDILGNFILFPRHDMDIKRYLPFDHVGGARNDTIISSMAHSLHIFEDRLRRSDGFFDTERIKEKSTQRNFYQKVLIDLDYLAGLASRLSEDQVVRFQTMNILEAQDRLRFLVDSDVWDRSFDEEVDAR